MISSSRFIIAALLFVPPLAFGEEASVNYDFADDTVDWTCCCPRWTVGVEALLMRRGPSAPQPLTDLAPQWNVADMHFNYEAGVRASAIRHLDGLNSVEVSYFGIYDQATTLSRSGVVSVIGPGFQYFSFAAQPYRFSYESTIHSLEANWRREWSDRCTLMAGFRWVELTEDFDHVGNTTPVYSIDTINHLYGFQIGAEKIVALTNDGRFRVEGLAKAGIYYNSANGEARSTGAFGGVPTGTAADGDDGVAFVGETGLVGIYQLRNGLDLRAGYQVMWLDGIATAPNQIPTFNTNTGVALLNRTYSAFYHGGFLGVVGTF